MIKMLRHDIVSHPTETQVAALNQKKTRVAAQTVIATNKRVLSDDPLEEVTEDEIKVNLFFFGVNFVEFSIFDSVQS